MNAPWEEFPEYSPVTIGWRMGYGEGYWEDWSHWYMSKSPSERAAYQERHPELEIWKTCEFYSRWEHPTP